MMTPKFDARSLNPIAQVTHLANTATKRKNQSQKVPQSQMNKMTSARVCRNAQLNEPLFHNIFVKINVSYS